ncbi:TetR/AcrR family transcriptional repressor of nem operon [Paraburkholderia sp. GAS199]|uniref:TetR/AcrR family transcriptional regulator n=1 Tax=Paraburkholderia sp. GAS199 TaxID=3035126 RepID=UPI003D24A865
MPRASREQVEKHRSLIQRESVRLFKERGINGVSVAEIMASAGLTHGGFYGHFESKDALATIACVQTFEQSLGRWKAFDDGAADEAILVKRLSQHFLSAAQRDDFGNGCPMTALSGDVSREPEGSPLKQAYKRGVLGLIETLMSFSKRRKSRRVRQQALVRLSMLVGALTLSRAVSGDPLSDEILDAARNYLVMDAERPLEGE